MIQISVADQIIQVINDLCQKFGIVMDWSKETILPIAKHLAERIIGWCMAADTFWIILCGIIVAIGITCITYSIKHGIDHELNFGLFIFGTFASIVCGVGLCDNTYDLIKCLTFPELKILEYIQSFMQ